MVNETMLLQAQLQELKSEMNQNLAEMRENEDAFFLCSIALIIFRQSLVPYYLSLSLTCSLLYITYPIKFLL